MPCRDYDDYTPRSNGQLEAAKETIKKQKAGLDRLARLLCFVCEYLPADELEKLYRVLPDAEHGAAGKELKAWWVKHQEADRKERERIAREKAVKEKLLKEEARRAQVKTEALRKLTSEERQLLGLS